MSDNDGDHTAIDERRFAAAALEVVLSQQRSTAVCALTPEGRIRVWHASAMALLGHSPADVEGRLLETFGPEERRYEAAMTRALFEASKRGASHIETALLTRYGERHVCRLDIRPQTRERDEVVGFIVLMRPVRGVHRSRETDVDTALEAAHRANWARLAGQPAWIGLDLAARITHLGDVAALLGLQDEKSLGRPLFECLHPVSGSEWPVLLHRAVRTKTPLEVAVRLVGSGEAAVLNTRLVPLYDDCHRLDGFTLVIDGGQETALAEPGEASANDVWLMAAANDLSGPMDKIQRDIEVLKATEASRLSGAGRERVERLDSAIKRMQAVIGGMQYAAPDAH